MNILVIGGGAREHAIVWKLSKSPKINKIYCAPGNAGISQIAECVNISATDITGLVAFAKNASIDYTVVGMDDPLVLGIVDEFKANGLQIFGPSKRAAVIEGSKSYSKSFMKKYNIPTASYEVFDNCAAAYEHVKSVPMPVVIKADGLALGKGVLICQNIDEANEAITAIMKEKKFGDSGSSIVIEEFLEGNEVSVLAFCDGKTIKPMLSSKDHKRSHDNDEGLNTGGMGSFSPCPIYTEETAAYCMENIYKKTVEGLIAEDREFVGIIFFGLMLTSKGIKLLEYNCRFGDPETQSLMPLLKTDLLDIFISCTNGELHNINIEWKDAACCCVVLASGGYPKKYTTGYEITGTDAIGSDILLFHAGTKLSNGKLFTNGGRIIGVTATGENLSEAVKNSYEAVSKIDFKDIHYRKDIGRLL